MKIKFATGFEGGMLAGQVLKALKRLRVPPILCEMHEEAEEDEVKEVVLGQDEEWGRRLSDRPLGPLQVQLHQHSSSHLGQTFLHQT